MMKSTMDLYSVQAPSRARKAAPTQIWLAKHASVQTPKFATALFLSVVSTKLPGPGTWPQTAWNPATAAQFGDDVETGGAVPEDEENDAGEVKVCAEVVRPPVES